MNMNRRAGWVIGKGAVLLLMVLAGLGYYVFSFWTPMSLGDYSLTLTFEHRADGSLAYSSHRIASVGEWVQAWWDHWCTTMHGRISDHLGAAVMLLGGRTAVNIVNSMIFVLAMVGICRFCFGRLSFAYASITLTGMLVFLPKIVGTLLWFSGSFNYLWGMVPALGVLLITRRCIERGGLEWYWGCMGTMAAFLSGAIHEALGTTLSFAMGVYGVMLLITHRPIPKGFYVILIVLFLSTLIPLLSPAMWARAAKGGAGLLSLCKGVANGSLSLLTFSLLPLLVSVCFVWKRPASLLSPLGAFAVANLGLSMLIGFKGGWGGGYFYLNFALLLYCLHEGRLYIDKHIRGVVCASCISCVLIAVLAAPRAYAIHSLYEGTLRDARPGEHITLDISPFGKAIPLQLYGALPEVIWGEGTRRRVCGWHEKPLFSVFLRNCTLPADSYDVFDGDSPSENIVRQLGDRYVVRLASDRQIPAGHFRATLLRGDGSEVSLNPVMYPWEMKHRIAALISGQKLDYMEVDYHNGFFYIVLPAQTAEVVRLDTSVTNLSKGKIEEISISLLDVR